VILALGSNLGDRLLRLRRAVALLSRHVEVEAVSSVYASDPVGYREQPEFLNAILVGRTRLRPGSLLELALETEREAGRARPFPGAPRTLDIDVVFYGDLVLDGQDLTLPHPRWRERSFVLAPLAEVAPALRAPPDGERVDRLWAGRREQLPPVRRVAGPRSLWRKRP